MIQYYTCSAFYMHNYKIKSICDPLNCSREVEMRISMHGFRFDSQLANKVSGTTSEEFVGYDPPPEIFFFW